MTIVAGYIVPGMPHPLLAPERSPAWQTIRDAFEKVREEIEAAEADLLLIYSTQWLSVIGHQVQADPAPEWTHVDPEWHELGEIPYRFRIDADYAEAYAKAARARGLHTRTVAYRGFPIDTGSVVALKLLNPDNRLPACIVSCNMYADRAETLVLGKAASDALRSSGKRAIAVSVTALSNRLFTEEIDPAKDHVSSRKDDEWNRKLVELLGEGRLEDVSQLAREFSAQAFGDQKLKAIWWLAALMGQHNRYEGRAFAYQPIWGTGAAVVGLTPTDRAAAAQEFDEADAEVFAGDRGVLTGNSSGAATHSSSPVTHSSSSVTHSSSPGLTRGSTVVSDAISVAAAPRPVGAYPHARRVGGLLFLSGIGPRDPKTDSIPGGPVHDSEGRSQKYDVALQTRAVIENVKTILEASGSSLARVIDVTVYLIDMDRDFATFNRVYGEHFAGVGATRTTVAIKALPTPIAVEFKVIAAAE